MVTGLGHHHRLAAPARVSIDVVNDPGYFGRLQGGSRGLAERLQWKFT